MTHTTFYTRAVTRLTGCMLLLSAASVFAETTQQPIPLDSSGCVVTKCYQPRSQGRDKARQMAGHTDHVHLMTEENGSWYAHLSITPEYSQSFDSRRIGECLFGSDLISCGKKNNIRVQGKNVANRDPKAWLADHFYLPQDFESILTFDPQVKNFIFDMDLYLGLDGWCQGMYLRIHGPLTHSRWDLGFCEDIIRRGTAAHPFGYFTPDELPRSFLLSGFDAYAKGCAPGNGKIRQTYHVDNAPDATNINTIVNTGADGSMGEVDAANVRNECMRFEPLRFGRMENNSRSRTSFADLRAELGMNVAQHADYHLGFNIQAAAPTGTRKDPCHLFGPMVGNGHHWELGGGMHAHWTVWRSEDNDRLFGLHMDIALTHMFKDWQKRTFELKGRPNSAYMLAHRQIRDQGGSVSGNSGEGFVYAPVANISTLDIKVSRDLHVDAVFMANFQACGFSFDLGYNFWMQSCERFDMRELCKYNHCDRITMSLTGFGNREPDDDKFDIESAPQGWHLKGCAQMFAFTKTVDLGAANNPVGVGTFKLLRGDDDHCDESNSVTRLRVSQSRATIHNGPIGSTQLQTIANSGVDNPVVREGGTLFAAPGPTSAAAGALPNADQRIYASCPDINLTCNDLDFVRTRGLSHKVFGHASYQFDFDCWNPVLGLGGSAEFGNHNDCSDNCTKICQNSCVKCSMSQWAVWLKGGFDFH